MLYSYDATDPYALSTDPYALSTIHIGILQIHAGLGLEAVLVNPQLDWKLSGFDLLSEHSSVTSYDSPLRYAPKLVSPYPRSLGLAFALTFRSL